jgi:hypothetical protein
MAIKRPVTGVTAVNSITSQESGAEQNLGLIDPERALIYGDGDIDALDTIVCDSANKIGVFSGEARRQLIDRLVPVLLRLRTGGNNTSFCVNCVPTR